VGFDNFDLYLDMQKIAFKKLEIQVPCGCYETNHIFVI